MYSIYRSVLTRLQNLTIKIVAHCIWIKNSKPIYQKLHVLLLQNKIKNLQLLNHVYKHAATGSNLKYFMVIFV